jgi:hypothetical protein
MTFCEKCVAVQNAPAQMESSKMLCLNDAVYLAQIGRNDDANTRLEKAAQYAWGFNRPNGWKQ